MIDSLLRNVFLDALNEYSCSPFEYEKVYRRIRGKYHFLFRLGLFGVIVNYVVQIVRPSYLMRFRNGVIDDHASGPIKSVFMRYDVELDKDTHRVYITRIQALYGFAVLVANVLKAFKSVKIDNVVIYARCLQISSYIMSYYGYFNTNAVDYVLIADTSDPKRQALGVVANLFSVPVYSFSVIKTGVRKASAFTVAVYFCWTMDHKELLLSTTKSVVVLMGSSFKGNIRVPVRANGIYGLVLNAKYIKKNIENHLLYLKSKHDINNIIIRPHPGNKDVMMLDNGVLRDWHEPIDKFFEGVDCLFAPNTNAMVEALLNGVPVVYVQKLGEGVYDYHGLVSKGVVLPFDESHVYPQDINDFYQSCGTQKALAEFFSQYHSENIEEKAVVLDILKPTS